MKQLAEDGKLTKTVTIIVDAVFLTKKIFDRTKQAYEDVKQLNSKKPAEQKVSKAGPTFWTSPSEEYPNEGHIDLPETLFESIPGMLFLGHIRHVTTTNFCIIHM